MRDAQVHHDDHPDRTSPDAPPGIAAQVQALRKQIASAGGSGVAQLAVLQELDAALARLDAELALVLTEHQGMADELIKTYEQLGIVFEITRHLSAVRTEAEVLKLFLDSLTATYHQHWVALYTPEQLPLPNHAPGSAGAESVSAWVERIADLCRREHRVVVDEPDTPRGDASPARAGRGPAPPADLQQLMAAPVYSGDVFVAAILLGRSESARTFDSSDMLLLDSLCAFCGDLTRTFRLVTELDRLSIDMVRALVGTVDQKDHYTSGHSQRVGHYARLLGEELALDQHALRMLEWSALLHDIGKIGIRDDVLKKAGRLTEEEFAHIKEHPVRSFEVVRRIPQLADALDGVLHHHEHYDGKGYPSGLAGEQIPLQARIIQIADVFDALTSTRAYRAAFNWQQALGILQQEAGTTVDPHLVPIFDRLTRRMRAGDAEARHETRRQGDDANATAAPLPPAQSGRPTGPAPQAMEADRVNDPSPREAMVEAAKAVDPDVTGDGSEDTARTTGTARRDNGADG